MAVDSPSSAPGNGSPVVAEPTHFVPPSARELRAQAVQRLQVGLFGLAAMLLIVGLASIINDQLRRSEALNPAAAASQAATNTDPLADIGVVPAADPAADATAPAGKGDGR